MRQTGSAEVHAFDRGYALLKDTDYDFIVKLDGDLSFDPDYFEELLERFRSDERLGIASGVYQEQETTGSWREVKMPSYHAFGACKVIRRTCFEAIEGFLTTPGWDTVDEIRALNLGWKTGHFDDLKVRHHKPEGAGMGLLRTSAMHGEIHYVTDGDPAFLLLKAIRRLSAAPFLLNGLALLFGYLRAFAKRRPMLVTRTEAKMYRRMLRERMWDRAKQLLRHPAR
jgi:GT2 family glycosyltransferase